jgi:hypothetical protein
MSGMLAGTVKATQRDDPARAHRDLATIGA